MNGPVCTMTSDMMTQAKYVQGRLGNMQKDVTEAVTSRACFLLFIGILSCKSVTPSDVLHISNGSVVTTRGPHSPEVSFPSSSGAAEGCRISAGDCTETVRR